MTLQELTSGLMTDKEQEETHDTVLGYLIAENVFERIKKHYQKQNSNDNNSAKDCQYDEMTEAVKQKFNEWLEENGGKEGALYQTFSDEELEKIFLTAYEKNKR